MIAEDQQDKGLAISLAAFFSAWEDSEFIYVATGEGVPDNGLSQTSAYLSDTLRDNISLRETIDRLPDAELAQFQENLENTPEFMQNRHYGLLAYLNSGLRDPVKFLAFAAENRPVANVILSQMQENLPAAEFTAWRNSIEQWSTTLESERQKILTEYGIDTDTN